MGSNGEINSKT